MIKTVGTITKVSEIIYNRKLKVAQNNEIKNVLISCEHDSNKLWKKLKRIYNNDAPVPDFIQFDDQKISDPKVIATKFNEYFVSSIVEINNSIPYVPYEHNISESESRPWNEFEPTRLNEVVDMLFLKRKKSGINNVNSDMVTLGMREFGNEIVDMINESFTSGTVPLVMKRTVITPIPKVARTVKSTEFRPINNSHPLDKVQQNIVKAQLEKHLHENKILNDVQSAFRAKHSCETSLNLLLLKWKVARMRRKKIVAVFLDFKRAFETVDREILLLVLERCGIGGSVLRWFASWLENREQCTRFRDMVSDEIANLIGIPQGTTLSCILFILYINDLPKVVKNACINLFADDTLVWVECDNVEEGILLLNEDLERISKYLKSIKLKLNTLKTKYMIVSGSSVVRGD